MFRVRLDSVRQKLTRATQLLVGLEAAVVDLDLAVDRHVRRGGTEAGDLGVVADLHLQRLRWGYYQCTAGLNRNA